MKSFAVLFALVAFTAAFSQTPEPPQYLKNFSSVVGKNGTMNADGSFRINIPRTDVNFKSSNGMPIPADLGLATYVALSGTEEKSLAVGDVAMLEGEIDRVIDILRNGKFEIVALHNHMTVEEPRLFFLHFQVSGRAADIARTFRAAINVLGHGVKRNSVKAVGKPVLDTDAMAKVFGAQPQVFPSGVVRFSNPRKDAAVEVLGGKFLPGMGMASWAAFSACECGQTMVMGDTCCFASDLQAVVNSLRDSNIHITAIHNHVLNASEDVIFLHYEGEGDALTLSAAIKKCWGVLKH